MSNFLLDSISLFVARRAGIAPIDNSSAIQATHRSPVASRPSTGESFEAIPADRAQRASDTQLPVVQYPVLHEAVTPPEVRRSRTLNLLRTSASIAVTPRLMPATQTRASRQHESHQATVFLTESEKVRLQIMQVQLRLTSLAFYEGPIDGNLNPETVTGVRHFQTLKGMRSSGTLAAGTLSALGVPPTH
jgi:Putative peptidoglycan binding domain